MGSCTCHRQHSRGSPGKSNLKWTPYNKLLHILSTFSILKRSGANRGSGWSNRQGWTYPTWDTKQWSQSTVKTCWLHAAVLKRKPVISHLPSKFPRLPTEYSLPCIQQPGAGPYSKPKNPVHTIRPHNTVQYYYPICALIIPIRIFTVTIITIVIMCLVSRTYFQGTNTSFLQYKPHNP